MKLFISISLILSLLIALVSCANRGGQKEQTINRKQIEQTLLEANRQAIELEGSQIEDYVQRHNWEVQTTGTGLRYMIYEKYDGKQIEDGDVAVLEYSVHLINGERIYSSEEAGLKEFMMGKGGVEAGLEEGILLLRQGDRAKFIIPSHLAFGLTGDQDKIPPKSTLIYDVKLLKIKR